MFTAPPARSSELPAEALCLDPKATITPEAYASFWDSLPLADTVLPKCRCGIYWTDDAAEPGLQRLTSALEACSFFPLAAGAQENGGARAFVFATGYLGRFPSPVLFFLEMEWLGFGGEDGSKRVMHIRCKCSQVRYQSQFINVLIGGGLLIPT